jgi:NADH dehydrogenase FAD-containing subunit
LGDVLGVKLAEDAQTFNFFNLGSMASLGDYKGVYNGTKVGAPGEEVKVEKKVSLLIWHLAYWGRQTSTENMMAIPFHWMKSFLFGRDVSKF